jgi:DNA/RNA endonuclease YhcR with UshA esterase domain
MPGLKLPGMSLIAWAAVAIAGVMVIFAVAYSKDYHLLAIAIPMLAALVIIPMVLTKMSQNAYLNAVPLYEKKAKLQKISNIDLSKVSEVVKIRGVIKNISFRWLNRPHVTIDDNTGTMSAILFTSLSEHLVIGEQVEVLGIVMRRLIHRGSPAISAISIKKLSTGSE